MQRGGHRWTILRAGKPQLRSETSYLTEDEAEALQAVGCLAQTLSDMIGQTVERGRFFPTPLGSEPHTLRR
jgi:hypothetical protein